MAVINKLELENARLKRELSIAKDEIGNLEHALLDVIHKSSCIIDAAEKIRAESVEKGQVDSIFILTTLNEGFIKGIS